MASATASLILLFIIISCSFSISYAETNTLKQGQLLRDWEQLVSPGKVFRLGFFSPNLETVILGSEGPRYLGVWFERVPIYSVWVANRESPVPDSSGALSIGTDGKLKITYQGGQPVVINPSQAATTSNGNFTASLLDSGNLVIRQVYPDGMTGPVLWQSFDYPHHMLLPGMKLGMNLKTGHKWELTSWLSEKAPAPGAFKLGLDPTGVNQLLVWRRGEFYWSSGEWKNGSFEQEQVITERNDIYDFKFVENEEERYFSYAVKNSSVLASRWDLDTLGQVTLFTLQERYGVHWIFESSGQCKSYGKNLSAVCLTENPSKCRTSADVLCQREVISLVVRSGPVVPISPWPLVIVTQNAGRTAPVVHIRFHLLMAPDACFGGKDLSLSKETSMILFTFLPKKATESTKS